MERVEVLVAGGGVSGLAAAWWLARAGVPVAVWESDARAGGKIASTQRDGYLMERAACMLLNFRPEVSTLLRQAGLEPAKAARTQAARSHRYLLQGGRLQPVPMRVGALVASPLWSLRGKLRLLAEPLVFSRAPAGESVSAFVTRRLGREMLDKAMEPFVAGTLAADADRTCAAAALPRLAELERRYGSLAAGVLVHRVLRRRTASRTETFSFRGGMATLVDVLAATPGVGLRTGHRVVEVAPDEGGWRVTASAPQGTRTLRASHLILATPAPAAAALLGGVDAELAALLRGIVYAPLALVHAGLARESVGHPLDGTGFLAPRAESAVLTGNLWMSALFAGRAPPGKVLLSSYLGGARAPQVADWDDERIADEALRTLRPLLDLRGEPEMIRIDRHAQALPLYHGAYAARMQAVEDRLRDHPGLHLEANYRGGVSVRDRLLRGHAVAERILGARPSPSAARPLPTGSPCPARSY